MDIMPLIKSAFPELKDLLLKYYQFSFNTFSVGGLTVYI